jgi:hypothetical protein
MCARRCKKRGLNYIWSVLPRTFVIRLCSALKRGTSEGVTTPRELPAKFCCVRTAKSVQILAANWSIFAAKTVSICPSCYGSRVLGLHSSLLVTFHFYDWLVLGCKTLFLA